ncbi:MAG: Holliday junction resolvase RuvX [Patescibacteria group bacterium]
MRYLGIDYGKARIGAATADEETGIAIPRGIIRREDDAQAIAEIRILARKEGIEKIVVGLPLAMDGAETEMSRAARAFAEKLSVVSAVPVAFENEMLTTRMAGHAGVAKDLIDASSAAIILQSYLDKKIEDKR